MTDHRPGAARLDHVDGLRSIAILWVAVYHYAYFWTTAGRGTAILPYDDAFAWVPLANVGYLGVYLFFIVSGFVIALSLQRSASVQRFWVNRMIRLWPTLLLCGTITFAATSLLGPPDLTRSWAEYLISLTFVPPAHVAKAIGAPPLEWLDGAYWSLWTEVRFYIIAGFLFFAIRGTFLLSWSLFALVCSIIHVWGLLHGGLSDALSRALFAEHQPFFSAGIALASLRFGAGGWLPRALLTIAAVQAFAYPALTTDGMSVSLAIGLAIVFGLAVPVMLARGQVPILSSRGVVSVGVASYAYYLLHQNVGIALLTTLDGPTDSGGVMIILGTQMGLLLLSIFLTRRVEEPLRRWLRGRVRATA